MAYLTQQLATHADQSPDGVALRCDDQQLSWAVLLEHVEALGAWIISKTPACGSVAIDLPTSLDFSVAFLASVHVGRRAIVYDHSWSEQIRTDVESSIKIDLTISSDTFPDIRSLPSPKSPFDRPVETTPLMVGFTSGSTGKVKGYERTHGSWVSSILSAQSVFEITAEDRVCAPGSVSFSLFLYALVHCVYAGASLRLCQHFQPKRILEAMRADHSTVLLAVPTQARFLIDIASRSDQPVSDTLRMIISSGAKWRGGISAMHRRAISNAEVVEFYGASELSFVTAACESDNPPPNSVGKPFAGVSIDIRASNGARMGHGETGVIWVKSAMLFSGYVVGESPESKWDADYFTVGDHGYLDTDGYLYVVGREKRMIVTSGANLYPEAVEAVISEHCSVDAVSVLGIDEVLRGQRVVAFIKFKKDATRPTAHQISEVCRLHLGQHAVPSKFYLVDDWPLAASGKTNHEALIQMIRNASEIRQL